MLEKNICTVFWLKNERVVQLRTVSAIVLMSCLKKRPDYTSVWTQVEAKYDLKVQKLLVTLVKCPSGKKTLYVEQVQITT